MCTAIMGLLALLAVLVSKLWGRKRTPDQTESRCPFKTFFGKKQAQSTNPLGLGWKERFLGGSAAAEAEFIQQAMDEINEVQENNKKAGKACSFGRAFHAKIQAGIANAEFRVLEDIPQALQVGFLQPGASMPVAIRFSNAGGVIKPDTAKDLRGIALRVSTPAGEIHDFLATNGPANHARDARQFITFAKASSGSKLLLLPRLVFGVGLFETVRMFRTVIGQVKRKVKSLCTETYFSRSAYAFGDQAVRFQIAPGQSCDVEMQPSDSYLREDLVERLKKGPVTFKFQVQFFANEKSTPVEDGSVIWPTELLTIAEIVIPQQNLDSAEALEAQAQVENLEFNPWNSANGFRPLGSLNRARLLVYKSSQDLRSGRRGKRSKKTRFCFFSKQGQNRMNSDKTDKTDGSSGCPFGFGSKKSDSNSNGTGNGTDATGAWRPKSRREGIGPIKYVWWNMFYWVMETLNRMLSRDRNRKVSWDKWPPYLGLLYLLAKIRFNRSNALTDPYDYATNDNKEYGKEPTTAKHCITADGSWVSDRDNPQMGTPNTRFGSNIPPKKVRPDVENITPSAREVGRLRWRRLDDNGREITIPAMILNDMAGGWIQFQFHNFGGNTKRDPVSQCPHLMARDPKENWPGNQARIDRSSVDHTRLTQNGRPTPLNEKTVAWIQGQIYGSDESELNPLRSFEQGKMRLGSDLRLPEDPSKAGIDQTGFNNNFNALLSFLHWLFVMEHNAIAEHYAYFHPDWDDENLFQMARKVNVAQIARIHTIQWTEDLLQHPTLQLGMHADWYGFLGQRFKMYLMRLSHRFPLVSKLLAPIRKNDFIWGMPGSVWEHHDGPFQVPKHFRMVYRLHEMILSEREIVEPGTDRLLERVDLLDFIHGKTRPLVAQYGYEVLAWSFVRKSCGALTLHNFPRALTQFENQQDGELTDLAERDIFRERTDGTGTYNEFRHSVGEPPVADFMELTGGDAAMAAELERVYEGNVNAVDAGIGILVEPKPAGFALGFCQFYQFVLNAPRRVKSNRHLTEGFTYAEYQEGMDWVEHGGGMFGAMARHLPGIRPQMEGVTRAFAPWPETETFPLRQLDETHKATANVFKADLRTFGIAAVTAAVAGVTGAVSWVTALLLLACVVVIPMALTVRRMLAMRYMQLCWKKCYTDKRHFMFGTLTRAENSINRAAHFGALHAMALMLGSAGLAVFFASSHPIVAVLLALVALSSLRVRKWSRTFAADAQVLKIALRGRMREGREHIDAACLKGNTAFEKRRRFNSNLPSLVCARSRADGRVYAADGNVDMAEFERLFRSYAPGRDHLTSYDFDRLIEGESVRDAREGRGNWLSRLFGRFSASKRAHELIHLFADLVVEEDKKLVPAISKGMLLRFYQGSAQAELKREQEEGDRDPSPVVCR